MIKNLVLSCGGVSGITYIGCLKILYQNNLLKNVKNILGCSVGSIFALCICLDYTYEDLYKIFTNIDINILTDIDYDGITGFINKYGFQNGEKILNIIKILINAKTSNKDITFKELYDKYDKNLIVATTCLTTSSIEYFNYENNPDMRVVDAIHMSISIPFIFTPVSFNNKLYVDGGVLNGYPINYFDNDIEETIGILIGNDNDFSINNIEDYTLSVVFCGLFNVKKSMYEKYKDNTILVNVDSECDSFNFFIDKSNKETLVNCGSDCCMKYLNNNFFNKYLPDKKKDNKEEKELNDNKEEEKLNDNEELKNNDEDESSNN